MGINLLMQVSELEKAVDWVTRLTGSGIMAAVTILWLTGRIITKRELDRAIVEAEKWRLMAERTQDDNEQLVGQNERLEGLLDKAFKATPQPREPRHDVRHTQ